MTDPVTWRDHGARITHVALDYGGTLTSGHDPICPHLRMRPVTPAAADAVGRLADVGITLVLVSNTRPGQDRRPALKAAGILHLFARVYLSHETGLSKPDPRVWRHVLNDLGVAPGRLAHCGNNPTCDIYPAAAQGIRSVLLSRVAPRHLPPGAAHITTIGDLPGLIGAEAG